MRHSLFLSRVTVKASSPWELRTEQLYSPKSEAMTSLITSVLLMPSARPRSSTP